MGPAISLRLEVEAMRYQIIHAFMLHSEEIQEELKKATDETLAEFDFQAIVKSEARKILHEAVKRAVSDAISSLVWKSPLREMIQSGVADQLTKAVKQVLEEQSTGI